MKQVYWHDKQLEFLNGQQRTKVAICGRGFGKTVMIGGSSRRKMQHMPKSKHFIASSTYKQLLTKTLPVIFNKWTDYGFKRHYGMDQPGHYVIGVRPPKQWATPYQKPERYENVITFWNGFTLELLSMDRPDLARGGSYDGGEVDEALLIKKDHYSKVLLPATRGTSVRFIDKPYHKQINFYTSVPWTQDGQWLFEYEERAALDPKRFLFLEGKSIDNPLITQEDLRQWREEMDHLDYMVEVENMRIMKSEQAFYHTWDDNKHLYAPRYEYKDGLHGIEVSGDRSRDKNKAIEVSFDFSGWFNCCTVYQKKDNVERMIDKFFVKQEKISILVDNFCNKYIDQKNKICAIYGEPRGHDRLAAGGTLYDIVINQFKKHGWLVLLKAAKKTQRHEIRHDHMNQILSENNPRLPKLRVNRENCKDVVIAIKMAEITPDFKKSKKNEKDRKFPQEHATHFTDTIDYFFEQKYGAVRSGFSSSPGFASIG